MARSLWPGDHITEEEFQSRVSELDQLYDDAMPSTKAKIGVTRESLEEQLRRITTARGITIEGVPSDTSSVTVHRSNTEVAI